MARDAAAVASFAGSVVRPVVMVDLEWDGADHVSVHSRLGTISYAGEDFLGVGRLGSIQGIAEGEGQAVRNVTLTLAHVRAEHYSVIANAEITNRPGRVMLGNVTEAGALAGTPVLLFEGAMRAMAYRVRRDEEKSITNVVEIRLQSHHAHIRRTIQQFHDHPYLASLVSQEQAPPVWPE